MKRAIPFGVLAIGLAGPAMAKDTQFWNLTSSTVKSARARAHRLVHLRRQPNHERS